MKYEVKYPNFENLSLDNEKIRKMMETNHQPNPPKYEDTFFKDLADDIKQSQQSIENKLDNIISENQKSEKSSKTINIVILIVGVLTLIATIVGVVVQLL